MTRNTITYALILLLLSLAAGISPVRAQQTATLKPARFNNLPWHFLGPGGAGGRLADIQVVPGNPDIVYVAGATGGIFKTTDGCDTWTPIFDQAATTLSIGDMAIAPGMTDRIWAGTGAANGEQSSASIGDGIYRSDDGGMTWKHMGLSETQHIARLAAHPHDPDMLFVAAAGDRWGWNPDRGLYRTRDAGVTWEKILYIDEQTGMSDVQMHPDGKTLFASSWQQYRSAWAHLQKGRTSALYRSDDQGNNWTKLEIGYPGELIGRIAVVIAPSDPNRIYACLESDSGGLYRSDDKGLTWNLVKKKISTSYWYGRLYVNPKDADHLFVMGVHVAESKDGGHNFTTMKARGVHVDHHIIWLNPDNLDHRLLGNDGGLYRTFDGGEKWEYLTALPFQQFYAISVDNQTPYWIYGGLQDNGVVGFPVDAGKWGAIADSLLFHVCGGDGFWSASDPGQPWIVYGESQYGWLVKRDKRTGSSEGIGAGGRRTGKNYRFNWNTPFFISTHPPHALYLGGNILLKSVNQGSSWDEISGDLSKNEDLSEKTILGMKPLLKPYASCTALAESPLRPGVIFAGTDDGKLQRTLDDGASWTDLSDRLPMTSDRFITRIICSAHDPDLVYVAAARYYEANDFSPYLFRSRDRGESWESVTLTMPKEAIVKGFAEHPAERDLLVAGIHNGLLISTDGGLIWERVSGTLPPVAVDDVKIRMPENHLILGTYGRGIIISDAWLPQSHRE